MTNVWYIGPYGKRQLSVSDWAAMGAVATEATEWSLDNGWSIPESQFTPIQLARLAASDEFLTGQDGPRVKTALPPVTGGGSPYSVYFEKMKAIYDQFKIEKEKGPVYTKPYSPREVVITSNNFVATTSITIATPASPFTTTAPLRRVVVPAFGIRLVYTNTRTSTAPGVDSDNGSAISFTASIELNGQNYSVSFGGKRLCTLDPGATIVSDIVWIEVVKGDILWPRTCLQSGNAPWTVTGLADAQAVSIKWSSGDNTATDSAPATGGAVVNDYGPVAIIGTPTDSLSIPKAFVVQGQSITRGSTDGIWNNIPTGWLENGLIWSGGGFIARALSDVGSVISLALGGDTFTQYNTGKGHYRRQNFVKYATMAIVGEVTNDLVAYNLSQAQAQILLTAKRNKISGIQRNITYTIPPYTSTTDNYATVQNQTVKPSEASRVTYNEWVRDGMPIGQDGVAVAKGVAGSTISRIGDASHPFYGYLEVADVCETSRNSGKWAAAERVYNDGAITAGQKTLVCNSATFTAADIGKDVLISGAGNSTGVQLAANTHIATITAIVDSHTVTVNGTSNGNAINTVTGAKVVVCNITRDGVHPGTNGHKAIAAAIKPRLMELAA